MKLENAAVVVIDVQRGLFDVEPRPYEADEVVDRINRLADKARSAGAPVVFVQHETRAPGLAFGSDAWQLARGLVFVEGDVLIRKTTPDAYLRTPLEGELVGRGIERVVICGYATEFCVDTTARRSAALGFPVILAADAHTTQDKGHAKAVRIRVHHNATLSSVTSFGPAIRAVPEEDIEFVAR